MRKFCLMIIVSGFAMLSGFVLTAFAADDKAAASYRYPVSSVTAGRENIEWSTAYSYHVTDGRSRLPRVLLIGDSITAGYQGATAAKLEGKVNVSYWASSYGVNSPMYWKLAEVYLTDMKYDAVHFCPGTHSYHATDEEIEAGARRLIALIREKQPQAKLIWCSKTPVTNEVTNAKSLSINKITERVAKEMNIEWRNDLYLLMKPYDHATYWRDPYHFKPAGVALQAQQVANTVLQALGRFPARPREQMEAWFDAEAKRIVAGCVKTTKDGIRVYEPDNSAYYGAAWLRDYVMMLEGDAVPHADIPACSRRFIEAVSSEGFGVDCIKHDGTVVYKPGYGRMGENPGVDGSMFTVSCAYLSWKLSGDASFIDAHTLEILRRAMSAIPHDPKTGLVFIDPTKDWDRCSWGFNDQVRKTGSCLTESLLEIQASERLAEMLEAAGGAANMDDANKFRAHAKSMVEAISSTLWDEKESLYSAASIRCRQPDVWGSAFAVWLGVVPDDRVKAISRRFDVDYEKFVSRGQIRQLPLGTWWEAAGARGRYQNGGYWGVPSGWYAWTLAQTNPEKAWKLLSDLWTDYEVGGACEWHLGVQRANAAGYPACVTLPLMAIRRLQKLNN